MFYLVFASFFFAAHADVDKVVAEVERINGLRESLVLGVQDPVTEATFKAVCAPVGQEAKKVAQKNQWTFRQVSVHNRNPDHAPDLFETTVVNRFANEKDLQSIWLNANGKRHYFRKITVQPACLSCHGEKEKRPDFIKAKYKNDKAFGFKVGDLRGLYHVAF